MKFPGPLGPHSRSFASIRGSNPKIRAEEKFVRGAVCFLGIPVAERLEEFLEGLGFMRRHLEADEDAPIIGAEVSVVEQADVPAAGHQVQEIHQCSRTLRKL